MFVNFRSFPPSGNMFVMAQTSDGKVHFSPVLADHRSARDVFTTAISSGGVVAASWIDDSQGLPVEIAAYAQTGIDTARPLAWLETLNAAREAQQAKRNAAQELARSGSDAFSRGEADR